MRRAQWPSRLAAGHRRQAAHRGLEGHEHDATLDQVGTCGCILPGSWFFPRSARVVSRNLASERLAPLCPERGQLDNERRMEELGVAKPRPGWDASPPVGGTRKLLWPIGRQSCHGGNVAPAVLAAVAPDPMHDDGELAGDGHFGAAHTNSLGEREAPRLEGRGAWMPRQQHRRSLEQIGPQQAIAAFATGCGFLEAGKFVRKPRWA
jgi:hypothetical protein